MHVTIKRMKSCLALILLVLLTLSGAVPAWGALFPSGSGSAWPTITRIWGPCS